MPFVLILIGVVLSTVAVRNNQAAFFALVAGDFSNQGNFLYWIAALGAIGAVGYIPDLKKFSDLFLTLVLLVLFLQKGKGFFTGLTQQLQSASSSASVNTGASASIAPLNESVAQPVNTSGLYTSPVNQNTGSPLGNALTQLGNSENFIYTGNVATAGSLP